MRKTYHDTNCAPGKNDPSDFIHNSSCHSAPSAGAIVTVMPSAVTGFPPFTSGFGSEKFDSHNSILSAGTPAVYCFDTDYIRHERDVFSKISGVFGKILTIFKNFSTAVR